MKRVETYRVVAMTNTRLDLYMNHGISGPNQVHTALVIGRKQDEKATEKEKYHRPPDAIPPQERRLGGMSQQERLFSQTKA